MARDAEERPVIKSPLRYPGGKAFLCGYVERFLKHNQLRPARFVEPFAGGASVSLCLLGKDLVDSISLYDKDPLVSSFWNATFRDNSWLRRRVSTAPITLQNWEKEKAKPLNGSRSNAWKCLFLNRTSFSGILAPDAGPLGGRAQESAYKIDCRFYRETVNSRLDQLNKLSDRVLEIDAIDWSDAVDRIETLPEEQKNNCLIYLDPPFFHKADRLYRHYFKEADHEALAERLSTLQVPWLLSYDYCTEALSLFRRHKFHYRQVPVRYTSSSEKVRSGKKELVASNLPLPKGIPK
jgi:DNA adenine methylase